MADEKTDNELEKLREEIARALYEHWVEEDWNNEYCAWSVLLDKGTWLARADAVLAAPRLADLLRMKAIQVVPTR